MTTETLITAETNTEAAQPNVAGTTGQTPVASEVQEPVVQTTTTTPEGSDPKDVKTADPKALDPKQAAPEYTDFSLPEGVETDPEVMDEFKKLAKASGLKQENAQELAALGGKVAQKVAAKQAELAAQARKEWKQQSVSDKEFGGDKIVENLGVAKRGFQAFATPEMTQLIKESGLGDHPEFIRFFYRVGKSISEDRMVMGGNSFNAPKNPAEVLYGNNKK